MIEISEQLILADEFNFKEEATLSEAPNKLDEINLSLPAALCDDKLLCELKSIPKKMGFKIGEVADLIGIKQYVLRYWESEFDILNPKKASNNQRYYTKKDVENAYIIRKLLHRDRFSIEGAKSALSTLKNYARREVKKDLEFNKIQTHLEIFQDKFQDKIDDLVFDIREIKALFI